MLETHAAAADEQLIMRSNEDILIHHSGFFFTEGKFIQRVLFFLDKLWWVSFDGSFSIWTSAAIIPPIVSSSEFGAATCCQASSFFFLSIIFHDFLLWQLQWHLFSLWKACGLEADWLADNTAINQVACKSVLTGSHLTVVLSYDGVFF